MTQTCLHCQEPFAEYDTVVGVAIMQAAGVFGVFVPALAHLECDYRAKVGGIGHHLNHDYWCDQMHDPDGGRTYRQSALEVAAGHYGWN